MHTFQFSFRGRNRYFDAENIFAAMVMFHALHEGSTLDSIEELHITRLS